MFFGRKTSDQKIQEQLIRIKFLINTLNKNSAKSKLKEKQFMKKAKKAMELGDKPTAEVYVRQSVQHRHMALKLLKLACRVEIMESQTKTHVQTNQISTEVVNVISSLTEVCNPSMTLDNINAFEQLFDDATIATNYTVDTLDGAMADGVSTTEENELMSMIDDQISLESSVLPHIDGVPGGIFPKVGMSKLVQTPPSNDLF